jgi:hypothetical protein
MGSRRCGFFAPELAHGLMGSISRQVCHDRGIQQEGEDQVGRPAQLEGDVTEGDQRGVRRRRCNAAKAFFGAERVGVLGREAAPLEPRGGHAVRQANPEVDLGHGLGSRPDNPDSR